MTVIAFTGHKQIRGSSLLCCATCGGVEDSLPTDCPGYKMRWRVEQDVYNGELDYRRGEGWVRASNHGTRKASR